MDLLRISKLAKATGVSLPTIHFYTREGLISPALKTAHNMAYYDRSCIDDIRLIKELQVKRYLPLSAIKLILYAKREGQAIDHVADMESVMSDIFKPVTGEAVSKGINIKDLMSVSGLSESDIRELEAISLIVPAETKNGIVYDDIDIRIAQIYRRLAEIGLKAGDMGIYKEYIDAIRAETRAIHEAFHRLPDHDRIPARELFKISNELKGYLALRIYRSEFQHAQKHDLTNEEKK